jgi:hypothetical protein
MKFMEKLYHGLTGPVQGQVKRRVGRAGSPGWRVLKSAGQENGGGGGGLGGAGGGWGLGGGEGELGGGGGVGGDGGGAGLHTKGLLSPSSCIFTLLSNKLKSK